MITVCKIDHIKKVTTKSSGPIVYMLDVIARLTLHYYFLKTPVKLSIVLFSQSHSIVLVNTAGFLSWLYFF